MKTAVVLFLLTTTGGLAVAAEFQVAEYRADVDDLVWNLGSQPGTPAYPAADADVEGVQESSRLVYGLELGTYQFPEIFDQYQSISNGENNPPEDAITLGPTIQFSPNSVAQLFYSDEQDQGAETPEIGDSFARRAGLTQTWYLARRQARITLGYEFERSETDDVYDDLQAHSVVFSSRFPLFWGLGARIQANYAQHSYEDYRGTRNVDSDLTSFQASINRSLSNRLLGELQFSYLDEDFEESDLSYRRFIWGLNVRYKY